MQLEYYRGRRLGKMSSIGGYGLQGPNPKASPKFCCFMDEVASGYRKQEYGCEANFPLNTGQRLLPSLRSASSPRLRQKGRIPLGP